MRLPFPKRRPNEGIWGGFGSKAPDKAYQPPVGTRGDSSDVPPKHRRLRLSKLPFRLVLRRGEKATPIGIVVSVLIAITLLVIASYIAIVLSR